MNDETYTPCTKCGRPLSYCKGQCCGKAKGCDCQEYGPMVPGCIREVKPGCPYKAVIPTLTVEDKSNLKDLADCFVHVSNINTTFYIDDKHRIMTTWAGPVEYDNYDLVANSLGLRSQFLIDFANERGAYYDKTGNYQVFKFGDGEDTLSVTLDYTYDPSNWNIVARGALLSATDEGETYIARAEIPEEPIFTDDATGTSMSAAAVYAALENGQKVIVNNMPLGIDYYNPQQEEYYTPVDGVSFSSKQGSDSFSVYCGNATIGIGESCLPTFGFEFYRYETSPGVYEYHIMVDGIDRQSY